MISAFHEMRAAFSSRQPLHLILVGDGREQKNLERQTADYGMRDNVHFAGFQGNPAHWMGLFDSMVQPSLTEGTPNSVLEALCLHIPVIATAVGGVPDLITDHDNGLLVPPKNISALAAAMQHLVLDSELRLRLANAAQETNRVYSPSVQKEKLMAVYQTALAS